VHYLVMISEDCYGFHWDSLVVFRAYTIYTWNCSNYAVSYCSYSLPNEKSDWPKCTTIHSSMCVCVCVCILWYSIWSLEIWYTVEKLGAHTIQ
jgi:hypothetical protein